MQTLLIITVSILVITLSILVGLALSEVEAIKELLIKIGFKEPEKMTTYNETPFDVNLVLSKIPEIREQLSNIDDRIVRNQIALVKAIQSLPDDILNKMDTNKLLEFVNKETK
jgi:hypothetical protein